MWQKLIIASEKWVPNSDHLQKKSMTKPEKKDPLHRSFFSCRPSAGAAPRSVPTQQTVYVVASSVGKCELLQASCHKMYLHINMWAHMHSKMIMNSVCTNISMIVSRALFAESCCSCWCYPLMHALANLFFTRDMACYLWKSPIYPCRYSINHKWNNGTWQ